MIKLIFWLVLAIGWTPAYAADKARARDEIKARPACVGIVEAKAWTDCMERFKDVRPKHEPATLQFKDWRT